MNEYQGDSFKMYDLTCYRKAGQSCVYAGGKHVLAMNSRSLHCQGWVYMVILEYKMNPILILTLELMGELPSFLSIL